MSVDYLEGGLDEDPDQAVCVVDVFCFRDFEFFCDGGVNENLGC